MAKANRVHSTPPTNTPISQTTPVLDPVFGLIESHRSASAAHSVALKEQSRLESIDDPLADSAGDDECHADFAAFNDLIQTSPTTFAGLVAWASYLDEVGKVEGWRLGDKASALVVTLVEALRNLKVAS